MAGNCLCTDSSFFDMGRSFIVNSYMYSFFCIGLSMSWWHCILCFIVEDWCLVCHGLLSMDCSNHLLSCVVCPWMKMALDAWLNASGCFLWPLEYSSLVPFRKPQIHSLLCLCSLWPLCNLPIWCVWCSVSCCTRTLRASVMSSFLGVFTS